MIWPRLPILPRDSPGYGEDEPLQMTGFEWAAMRERTPEAFRNLAESQDFPFPDWVASSLGLCIVCQRPHYDLDRTTCELCRGFGAEEDY